MNGIRRLLPLLVLGAALAVPAAAGARSFELHAGARGAHGFEVSLRSATVRDFGGQAIYFDRGSVVVSRTVRGQTLSRRLEAARGARITATRRLKRGRIRLAFGARGRVDLRFRSTGRMRNMGLDSCDATTLRGRRGVLHGTFRVRVGGVVHTLRRGVLRGRLAVESGGSGDCSDPSPIGGDVNLAVADAGLRGLFYDRHVGRVTRAVKRGRGWRQHDEIEVHRSYRFTDEVTGTFGGPQTASAHVQAGGPLLTGSLEYGPLSGFMMSAENTFAVDGPVSGALTARFDRLSGPATTMRPTRGTLARECEQCI